MGNKKYCSKKLEKLFFDNHATHGRNRHLELSFLVHFCLLQRLFV